MTTIGIIGAGKLGTVLARLSAAAGYRTLIAGSGDPGAIELIVDVMSPGAVAVNAADAARQADIVVLAVPLSRYRELPAQRLRGKVVVDAMNYWPPVDGILPEFEGSPSSTVVAEMLAGAAVVKAFSHLGYHQLDEDARPRGSIGRHAVAIAGDDGHAVRAVTDLVDRLGFDPVVAGDRAAGARFGPGTDLFGVSTDKTELARVLTPLDSTPPPLAPSGVTTA